jgi:zinc protease
MAGGRVSAAPPVDRFSLPNGLSIQLAPIAGCPTVSVWVWYRVGSKNEWPGITGASHWVEHMLFLGSPNFAKGEIDRAIVGVGGNLNAGTDTDFTAYFSTVPAEHLEVPLAIEADRMTRALIDPAEVERERTVIRSEREGAENWPEFRVDETLTELAFRRHPYRWDPLGYPEDILALTAADLKAYYQRFYGPKNATLTIAGAIDPGTLREDLTRRFGALPATGDDPRVTAIEPEPNGERRANLSGPGSTPYLAMGFRAPGAHDALAPAAIMLDVLLGGENWLFRAGRGWGPAREHPSARLYRALVDTGLAVEASSQYRPRVHPGLFHLLVQAAGKTPLAKLEAAIDRELEAMAARGPTEAEVREARVKIERGVALAYEGASRTAFRLGFFSVLGGPELEEQLMTRALALTPHELRAAAEGLFRPERRVVVGYTPTGE